MFKTRWFDDRVEKYVNDEVVKRLTASALIVEAEIKEVITQKGLVDTGLYRGTITHEIRLAELKALVGSPITNPPYPLFLELGTIHVPAHAPMRTGLANSKSRVQAIWR